MCGTGKSYCKCCFSDTVTARISIASFIFVLLVEFNSGEEWNRKAHLFYVMIGFKN